MSSAYHRDTATIGGGSNNRLDTEANPSKGRVSREIDTSDIGEEELIYISSKGRERHLHATSGSETGAPDALLQSRNQFVVTGATGSGKTHMMLRESLSDGAETSSRDGSLDGFRQFVRSASVASALLLAVFAVLYLQGAIPATVAVSLGSVLLVAAAAFSKTWYDYREQ